MAALAACEEGAAPRWEKTGLGPDARTFSANVEEAGANAATYEDRLGPGISIWADSVATLSAPVRSGARLSAFDSSFLGPEVLAGSLAVYVAPSSKDTIAIDLATQQEKWRLTPAQGGFLSKYLLTDGTRLCGLGASPTFSSGTVQCVTLATGAMLWSRPLPLWLNPAPNQGYGLPAQFAFHGGHLFMVGGGELHAFKLTDGTDAWTVAATSHHRSLVFVGDDLVVEGVKASCTVGPSCLRAVNPSTGATVAEYDAQTASFLWADASAAYFLTPTTGATRTAVKYDSATHQFTEDAALAATFAAPGAAPLSLMGTVSLGGLTPVLPSGKVFLITANTQAGGGNPVFCRYAVAERKVDWCTQLSISAGQVRLHPNALFLSGAYDNSYLTLAPEPGSTSGITDFRFYFGKWAFNTGAVHASR